MITFLLSQKIYSAHFEAVDVPYDFECGATNNDIIKECYRANSALPPYESNPCNNFFEYFFLCVDGVKYFFMQWLYQ